MILSGCWDEGIGLREYKKIAYKFNSVIYLEVQEWD